MSLEDLEAALRGRLAGSVQAAAPLAGLTTYRLGGPAGLLIEPASEDDLVALAEELPGDVDVLVLGRGSNILISDRGWDGVVLHLPPRPFGALRDGDRPGCIVAGAAASLPVVANYGARRGLAGIEFMIAVPGSVGGAVRMNAGAHGGETADVLTSARILDLDDGAIAERAASELGFSYRHSNLRAEDVVLDAVFDLTPDDEATVRSRMDGFRKHRAETQPPAVQNAGSTFKNPEGDHAGRLVEAAGLKGFKVGGAAVSRLHANFFVTDDSATAQDVYDLVHQVAERVAERFGVALEPEVRFMGDFR